MTKRVLILGGAGFIGSHLVHRFAANNWSVTVIDGLLSRTGACRENLNPNPANAEFLFRPIEAVHDLTTRLAAADLVIDAMAWTAHLEAMRDPTYDLKLNAESHLVLLNSLTASSRKPRVIYLGSRGQYGAPTEEPVTESAPMEPKDIQGIHKLAAESYFRVLAPLHKFDAVSLRVPNCFGECQPVQGLDIGLIGGFIRNALQGQTIEVFGRERSRCILYVGDLAEIVYQLALRPTTGFLPLNVGGHHLSISELAETIVRLVGKGRCVIKEIPAEIKAIDAGSVRFSSTRLEALLGPTSYTPLEQGLSRTIQWFQANQS